MKTENTVRVRVKQEADAGFSNFSLARVKQESPDTVDVKVERDPDDSRHTPENDREKPPKLCVVHLVDIAAARAPMFTKALEEWKAGQSSAEVEQVGKPVKKPVEVKKPVKRIRRKVKKRVRNFPRKAKK